MWNAPVIAAFMNTSNRLAAACVLRSRAYQWAGACTGTDELIDAMRVVLWAEANHAAEVAA